MQHRRWSFFLPLAAAFALVGGPALADSVDVTESAGGLVVTISAEAANIHFDFVPEGCEDGHTPCLMIGAGVGTGGIPVSASGSCTAQQGGDMAPSGIECPATTSSIAFIFKKGGTWSAYEGGGGQHTGPCSPVPVTVQTGSGGLTTVVTSWDGCPETVICDSPKTVFAAVEADAADTIRGTCSSIVRH